MELSGFMMTSIISFEFYYLSIACLNQLILRILIMIATLTLNPALDKSTEVDRLIPEKKIRCPQLSVEAGGGGINVSKAIHELGGKSIAIFPAGGVNGVMLTSLLKEKSIPVQPVMVQGATRENFAISEISTNKQFRFIMPGGELSAWDIEEIRQQILNLSGLSFLVCSGSLPPGVSDGFIKEIAEIALKKQIKLVVDTSGKALKTAIETGVYLVKPNMTELCSLAGKDHLEPGEIKEAAMHVLENSRCEVIVVSMGPAGAMVVTKQEIKNIAAPVVKKLSSVGAGDSMVAGIVYMLEKGKDINEAVQFGIACGSAATIMKGTRLFQKEDAFRLFGSMQ
jgi:6-phosphofructokinase 2